MSDVFGVHDDFTASNKKRNYFQDEIGFTQNNQDTRTSSNKVSGASSEQAVVGNTQNAQTTQQGISQEGLNFMLSSILGGNQGLAALVSGEKAAGVYSSATTGLLASDLISRAAGEVAERNVKTQTAGTTANAQASTGTSTGYENAIGDTNTTGITSHDNVTKGSSTEQDETANVKADAGTVICTHLHGKKQLSSALYIGSVRRYKGSKITMIGYHYWAIPYVLRMRVGDKTAKRMEKFIYPLVLGRAKWICGEKSTLGFIAQYVLRPINWLVGVSVILTGADKKDYKILYKSSIQA